MGEVFHQTEINGIVAPTSLAHLWNERPVVQFVRYSFVVVTVMMIRPADAAGSE